MPTLTTGVMFLTQRGLDVTHTADGFSLTLRLLDRQGPRAVEAYTVRWDGDAARDFYATHRAELVPGRALELELENPRSFPNIRATETQARVRSCRLAPLAPSWQAHQATATSNPHHAQEARPA